MANISSHTKKILKDFLTKEFTDYVNENHDLFNYEDYFSSGFSLKIKHQKHFKTKLPLFKVSLELIANKNYIHFYLTELRDGEFVIFETFSDCLMDKSSNQNTLITFIKRQCYFYHLNFHIHAKLLTKKPKINSISYNKKLKIFSVLDNNENKKPTINEIE